MPTDMMQGLELQSERVAALPIVNHFLERLRLEQSLERFVPPGQARSTVTHARALGVLVRSIILEREPLYRQEETVALYAPELFGLRGDELGYLNDDRIGRALDRLFDANRSALLTDIVVTATQEFDLRFDELHNDSTSVQLCGQYSAATGRSIRGKRAPWITYGYSKIHRPDLKQLLLILTTTSDGGVPIHFRCEDGNTSDSRTHIETWDALCRLSGRKDFLYVGDSKLCSREGLEHIHGNGGRFVTVMPRSRAEDQQFRKRIQTSEPEWELVWNRRNPRRKHGPRDRWWVVKDPIPSAEAWPIVWVKSSLLAVRQGERRRKNITASIESLSALKVRLASPRSRIRRAADIDDRIQSILRKHRVTRYVKVRRFQREEYEYRQKSAGRPGPNTEYRRVVHKKHDIDWSLDEKAIEYDRKSDGMYPLLSNDKDLAPRDVLVAHKAQPQIEKRFQQTKSVYEIAPVMLKNDGRIEALFFIYFVALLVQGLIEREVRNAMKRDGIKEIPLYPEERMCNRPTTDQVLRLFSQVRRIAVSSPTGATQVFQDPLTELQRQVLTLTGVPRSAYTSPS